MNRKTLLMLAVLAALSAGTALAATAPASDSNGAPRAKLDTNGDGAIDRSEAARSPRLADRFDELDKNKDGKLSREEMAQMRHGGRHGGDRHGGHRGQRRRRSRSTVCRFLLPSPSAGAYPVDG